MKTIKNYKREIKILKEDLEHEISRRQSSSCYADDLSRKLDVAIDRLSLISEQKYFPSECSLEGKNKHVTTAVKGLNKISRMQERKP